VLLTVRDPGSWFESTHATIFPSQLRERVGAAYVAQLRKVSE
jgi:hypothetical protein